MTSSQPVNQEAGSSGRLIVIGTPIGNLGDLGERAIRALRQCDAIVCEDSRRTGKLLAHIGSGDRGRAALLVANEHTEKDRLSDIIDRLEQGQIVGLVTDAGMPTISDPGQMVVASVASAAISIEVVPGPTAVSAALAVSGLVASRFVFEGFLPRKGAERKRRIAQLGDEERAVVLYEAPHRLQRTLADLADAVGPERSIAVARELTKLYEQVVRGSIADAIAHFDSTEPRGEFVLVIEGKVDDGEPLDDQQIEAQLVVLRSSGLSTRDAVASVVAKTGEPKRRIYDLANRLAAESDG